MPADRAEITDAWEQLVVLAEAMRKDWDYNDAWGAIRACQHAGWPFARALRETVRLLLDGSEPRDLRAAAGRVNRAGTGHPLTAEERAELRENALASAAAATDRIWGGERANPSPAPDAGSGADGGDPP